MRRSAHPRIRGNERPVSAKPQKDRISTEVLQYSRPPDLHSQAQYSRRTPLTAEYPLHNYPILRPSSHQRPPKSAIEDINNKRRRRRGQHRESRIERRASSIEHRAPNPSERLLCERSASELSNSRIIRQPPLPAMSSSSSVKRACDACHRRKVKCDGINPCRNCSSAQLSCTYHAIPQKKGPKGSRAKVISELRETQRQTTLSSKVANRLNGVNSPPCSPTLSPTPGLLTNDMIKDCIEFFFANMYPTLPILHRGRLEQQAMYADQNVDTYCLLTSLCAFMMIQPGMGIPGDPLGLDSMPGANLVSGNLLMEETLRVRKSYDHLETPTLSSLVTSFFLFGCYFGLDLHNKAWFHLREATTLAHILGLTKEETYLQFDAVESSRRRRLYWLLFVTER